MTLSQHPRLAHLFRRVPRDYQALRWWADRALTRANGADALERAAAFELHALDAFLRGDGVAEQRWIDRAAGELLDAR